ncbi:MAG: ATP-grasp domain-containing protein [Candidatus Rokubacteria bacterium]|nr:ATP-grasp domain-containing protein [Candidatus Rokubacteria bacterium]
MGETWIGVTGLVATENPHPGLGVIRALRRTDPSWRILALVPDRSATAAYAAELIDAHAIVPPPWAGPAALAEGLRRVARQRPMDLVIPTLDAELPHYVALRETLRRLGIHACLPSIGALRAREKRRLPALGRRARVSVPDTLVLPSAPAVWRAAPRLRYPQILKGALVDSVVVHSADDLVAAAGELAAQWGYPILAQPLIHGEEYDVAAVAREGRIVGAAVMKKLSVTNKGTAWAGVTVEAPRLVELARRLVAALHWNGGLEIEFILSPDGRASCFEINPRLPSWIALAADAGANLPAMLVDLALGGEVEPALARPGLLFTRVVSERVFPANPLASLDARHVRSGLLGRPAPAAPAVAPRTGGRVALSGLNAADNPSPGLTVARALLQAPTPPALIGLTHEVLATGAYAPGVWEEVRLLPYPSREEGGYPEALVEHCRRARVDCLVPCLDIEIPLVARLASRLEAAGVATLVPSPDAVAAVAKPRLPALAESGFRLPRSVALHDPAEIADAGEALGWPFVLKGPVADARVVATDIEARAIARRLAATWGFPLIAQEFIRGEEFGIAAVADRSHRVVGVVTVRKDIRTRNGNTWGGSVVVERALLALAERFADALDWVGPFELEVIRHPRRGPVLIEVNPRFPAWIALCAGAGANLPWAAVRAARGEHVSRLAPKAGTFYARIAWDTTTPIERMGALAVDGRMAGDAG